MSAELKRSGMGRPKSGSPWLIAYLTIWRSWGPWGRWLRVGPALLFLAASIACNFNDQPERALTLRALIPMLGLSVLLPFASLLVGLLQLNHPTLARTLPSSSSTLRKALAVLIFGVLALSALLAVALVLVTAQNDVHLRGHRLISLGSEWVNIQAVVVKTLLATMGFLVVIFQTIRGRVTSLAAGLFGLFLALQVHDAIAQPLAQLPGFASFLSGLGSVLGMMQGVGAAALFPLVLVGSVAFSWVAARLCIGDGGPAHRELWRKSESARQALARGQGDWMTAHLSSDRRDMLRRLLDADYASAVSQPPSSEPFAKGMLMLGPCLHAASLQRSTLGACVPVLLIVALLHLGSVSPLPANMVVMVLALVGTFASFQRLTAALTNTVHEQAILVLLPGMPQGSALNRPLAKHLWRSFARVWLACVVLLALVAWALDAEKLSFLILAGAASGLLPLLGLARGWARHPRLLAAGPHQVRLFLTLLLAFAVAAAIGWLPRIGYAWGSGVIATVVFLALAGWLAWRWHRMPKEPGPFPLGRMAGRKASAAGAQCKALSRQGGQLIRILTHSRAGTKPQKPRHLQRQLRKKPPAVEDER